ncbi:MAG: hypothetical protein ABR927_14300 [Bacteroidales bacterium]
MRIIGLFCILTLILFGCKKDKELLTGDIMGKITVYNQDLTNSSDNSGVQVSLYTDAALLSTNLTDMHGIYRFENMKYGKYRIDLQKENYIESEDSYTFNHIGGYSPTLKDGSIYEIPDYNLTIDSIKVLSSVGELLVYLKIDGDTIIPFPYYILVGYYGNTEDVSSDNYSGLVSGIVSNWSLASSYKAPAVIYDIYMNLPPGIIYIRFYLLTQGQTIYHPINKEALGKPSNVISFTWQ